jgi:SAM-dependent methyltransferase
MKPGRRVLDLGCDRGGHTAPLAKAGATVVGVEKSKAALASAVQTKGVEYVRSDLEQALPFADASFDAVLALDVIEHLHHRDAFLLEIVRVLKPQGQIYLSAPNRATHWKTTARQIGLFDVSDPDHKIEYTLDELKAELERAGLTPLTIDPVVFDTPYALWIDFLGAISHKAYRAMWMRKRRRAIADPDQSTGFRIVATKKNQRPGAEND